MTRSTFLLVGQPSRGPLLAGAEHTKDWIQLLHRNKVYFRRATYPWVTPHIPRWNQSAAAKWWREVISNTCWQQRTGKVRLWREVCYFIKVFLGQVLPCSGFFVVWEDVFKAEDISKKGNVFFLLQQNLAYAKPLFLLWHFRYDIFEWKTLIKLGPNFNFKSFQTLSI